MRETEGATVFSEKLSLLLYGNNGDPEIAKKKYDTIEEIASMIITEITKRNLSDVICGSLEKHAYSVNDKIKDGNVRNMHILEAI